MSVIDRLEPYVRCEYVGQGSAKTFHLTIVNPAVEPATANINSATASPYLFRDIDAESFSLLHFIEQNVGNNVHNC